MKFCFPPPVSTYNNLAVVSQRRFINLQLTDGHLFSLALALSIYRLGVSLSLLFHLSCLWYLFICWPPITRRARCGYTTNKKEKKRNKRNRKEKRRKKLDSHRNVDGGPGYTIFSDSGPHDKTER
jgi:hypothetical protein